MMHNQSPADRPWIREARLCKFKYLWNCNIALSLPAGANTATDRPLLLPSGRFHVWFRANNGPVGNDIRHMLKPLQLFGSELNTAVSVK
jgi:hypothetical protein